MRGRPCIAVVHALTTLGLAAAVWLEQRQLRTEGRHLANLERLSQCDRSFGASVTAVIEDLERQGFAPWVRESWRSPEAQARAYSHGHSEVQFGYHNIVGPSGEPLAFAVDLVEKENAEATSTDYALAIARAARHHGLVTGILWGLEADEQNIVRDAIDLSKAPNALNLGWDPCHIEPAGVSLQEAMARARNGKLRCLR